MEGQAARAVLCRVAPYPIGKRRMRTCVSVTEINAPSANSSAHCPSTRCSNRLNSSARRPSMRRRMCATR